MPATMTRKAKDEFHEKAATLPGLMKRLERVSKAADKDPKVSLHYLRALKTQVEHGWFTDVKVLCRMTPEEHAAAKKEHGKDKAVKGVESFPIDQIMPRGVGASLNFVRSLPAHGTDPAAVEMVTATGTTVYVPTEMYRMLCARHPRSTWNLATDQPNKKSKEDPTPVAPFKVVVAEREVVAVLMSLNRS